MSAWFIRHPFLLTTFAVIAVCIAIERAGAPTFAFVVMALIAMALADELDETGA